MDDTPKKTVHFADEIIDLVIEVPRMESSTDEDEMEERWYNVSSIGY